VTHRPRIHPRRAALRQRPLGRAAAEAIG